MMLHLLPITLLGDRRCKFYAIFDVGQESPNSDQWEGIDLIIKTMQLLSLLRGN